jgi:hypothetical protein
MSVMSCAAPGVKRKTLLGIHFGERFFSSSSSRWRKLSNFLGFQTSLVGVDQQGSPHTLWSWSWISTFTGTAGGTEQTTSFFPIDPGSGFVVMTVGALLCFWLRVMAIYRGWHLPVAQSQDRRN